MKGALPVRSHLSGHVLKLWRAAFVTGWERVFSGGMGGGSVGIR